MQLACAAYGIAIGRVVDRRGARPVARASLAFMRGDPAELGLLPDGEPPPSSGNPGAGVAFFERERERSVRPQVAVREANFWLLAAAFGLTMAGLSIDPFEKTHQ